MCKKRLRKFMRMDNAFPKGVKNKMFPKVLYHYCSTETFNLIIKNKTLRLSNVEKSNDNREKKVLKEIVYGVLLEEYQKNPFPIPMLDGTLSKDPTNFQSFWKQVGLLVYKRIQHITFSISLSSENDSQILWERYGNNRDGVVIGLNASSFNDVFQYDKRELQELYGSHFLPYTHLLDFYKVIYDPTEQINLIKGLYRKYFVESGICNSLDKNQIIACGSIFFFDLILLSAKCKDAPHKAEKEYRAVVNVMQSDLDEEQAINIFNSQLNENTRCTSIRYAANHHSGDLACYMDLKLEKFDLKSLLCSVYIGESSSLSEKDVYALLKQNGFNENIFIKKA